jgi:hypothetical protein
MIYHMVPKDMQGDMLYPLAELQHRYPEIYARQLAKYNDHPTRKELPNRYIPKLDCYSRDVLQFCPVHPHLIYAGLVERGMSPPPLRFYVLSSKRPAAIYDVTRAAPDEPIPEDAVMMVEHVNELKELPSANLAWLDKLAQEGKIYGMFVGIPHVLIRGSVSMATAQIIDWRGLA